VRLEELTLVTCSFNTPEVLATMLRSYVMHHGQGPHRVLIMENSTNEETASWLDAEGIPFVRNAGGRHSPSVDRALDLCGTRYALLVDTDVVFRRSVAPLLTTMRRHDLAVLGTVSADRGGQQLHPRVHPWFCFIDVERVRAEGIRFHDQERIQRTGSGGFYGATPLVAVGEQATRLYDVGATFYEDVDRAGLHIGHAALEPLFYVHYEGTSWHGESGSPELESHSALVRKAYQDEIERFRAVSVRGSFRDGFAPSVPLHTRAATEPEVRHRIGFLSEWFARGQAYVTRAFRDALSTRHDTFVFARTGRVERTTHLESTGEWAIPNLTTYPRYEVPTGEILDWIRRNSLDTVVFNEEYDWELVEEVKAAGVTVVTYLDFHRHDWKDRLRAYDLILCSTRRTWELVRDLPQAAFVGWAVDTTVFAPRTGEPARHTFFHNAGWLGINYRKMTPAVLLAFDALSPHLPHATLFVHSQVGAGALPPECQHTLRDNPRIVWQTATVPAPGRYHCGEILLFPSKLEGLGLPLPEGLSCGLPAITTDAPPMTEFVTSGENGLLVRVAAAWTRFDGIAFPETIVDVNDLVAKMKELGSDLPRAREMGQRARERALVQFDRGAFEARVCDAFERTWRPPVSASSAPGEANLPRREPGPLRAAVPATPE